MNIRRRHDSIDLEHLEQVLESAGYQIVLQDLHAAIEAERVALETAEHDDYRYVQGKLAGLRAAVRLPQERRKKMVEQERRK